MTLTSEEHALLELARNARRNAYAPYSRYAVGSAVLMADGRMFAGVNVENASYGLTVCAERVAVWKAISEGTQELKAVAVITADGAPPCGACLQVLAEFAPNPEECVVWLATPDSLVRRLTLAELLPVRFYLR